MDVAAKKRGVRAGERVEHILASSGVAHRDAPGTHAAFGKGMRFAGVDDPRGGGGVQVSGCDRHEARGQRGGDLGVGERRRLAHERRRPLPPAKECHASSAHVGTG